MVITGINPDGLGTDAARAIMAHNPKLVILASRTAKTIKEVIQSLPNATPDNVKPLLIDLADQDSIRTAAAELLKMTPVVDVLINNAGVMMNPEFRTTKQGIDWQFGINHIGHFLFANLIMSALLKASDGARVVSVTSAGHHGSPVRFDDYNFGDGKNYEPFLGYGQSKSANCLFAVGLTKRLKSKGLTSFSVHPGCMST